MGGLARAMGGLVGSAPACYGISLRSNPDISQKYKMGQIQIQSGQHTLARPEYTQKIASISGDCSVADVKILPRKVMDRIRILHENVSDSDPFSIRFSVTKFQELRDPFLRHTFKGDFHWLQALSLQMNLAESGVIQNR